MNKTAFLTFFLTVFIAALPAQNKYWIQFADKNGTPYSLEKPEEFLTKRSIDRRARYNIPLHPTDLPVNPGYIQQVKSVPHTIVRHAIKWLNGVVVSFDSPADESAGLTAIAELSCVQGTGKVRKLRRSDPPLDTAGWRTSRRRMIEDSLYGGSLAQVQQLNLDCLHDSGYLGEGMLIAVMDAGFASVPATDVFDSIRNSGRLLGSTDFVSGQPNAYVGGDHGTMVLSCMAANKPGTAMGTAPHASYWLMRTEEGGSETISEEYNWIRAAEFADSLGADIFNTSLGYTDFDDTTTSHTYESLNGRTAPMSIAANLAARKGIFVLNSAGNDGNSSWHYIGVAADADSICAVGSVNAAGVKSTFSSFGPTADGRIKPDLSAMGEGSWVCSGTICFPANGTSFSSPVLAGAVACFWQANYELNNIGVLNLLRQSASRAKNPDNELGWGIPKTCADIPAKMPVMLAADIKTTSKDAGAVLAMISKPSAQEVDTAANPGPYKIDWYYRQDPLSPAQWIGSAGSNNLSQLDTTFDHQNVNTLEQSGFYSVEFIAGTDTIGRTGEAETILISGVQTGSAVNLSWSESVPWLNYNYAVYRRDPENPSFVHIGNSTGGSYKDQGTFSKNGPYCYKVVSEGKFLDPSVASPLYNASQESCVNVTFITEPLPDEPFGYSAYIDPETSRLSLFLSRGKHTDITVELIDLLGRRVYRDSVGEYQSELRFYLEPLADYVYYIRVSSNLGSASRLIAK